MGIFNYCCALKETKGSQCKLHNEDGQDHTDGTIYAVDPQFKRKYPLEYSGYGYATDLSDHEGRNIYDRGHKEHFTAWSVTTDATALFVCSECARTILEVKKYEEVEALTPVEIEQRETEYLEKELMGVLKQRERLNKTIRSIRAKLTHSKK